MTELTDPNVQQLLSAPNYGVASTLNRDGSILSTVVWLDYVDGELAVNSAVGRRWPSNLDRDPHITLVVVDPENSQRFVEIRGKAQGTLAGAREHIDRLAHKYLGSDYPFMSEGEVRKKFVITPDVVRYQG